MSANIYKDPKGWCEEHLEEFGNDFNKCMDSIHTHLLGGKRKRTRRHHKRHTHKRHTHKRHTHRKRTHRRRRN
jgi:hypothetical protein